MHLRRKILFPFALLYGWVLTFRHFLYNKGVLKSVSHPGPVICVGNLSFGGTGKTPMTEYLIRLLKEEYRVAVLSRGYKRESRGFRLAEVDTTVREIGDEPFQYHRKFPDINVVVDADRNRGVRYLLQLPEPPEVILLDDAFQRRSIKAGLHILLTAYGDLYVDDLLVPAGNLRDIKREAVRAEVVIVTKCPSALSEEARLKIKERLKLKPHQHLFFTGIAYDTALLSSGEPLPLTALASMRFTLVTGIANPAPLVRFLEEKAPDFEHLRFPDHHSFSEKEIARLQQKACIVTTEKDYMRLRHRLSNLYYLPIKTVFLEDGTGFNKLVKDFVRGM